jgi:uroporphyrinogen-III decarboxylase
MTAFDFDYVPLVSCGCNTGVFGGMKPKIIEDTPLHTISTDHLGRTVKLCKGKATIPLPLDFPVKDMESWLKIKHLYEFCEERINYEALEKAKALQAKGHLTLASIPGGFDELRELMGEENLCIAYYEDPELIEDILSTISDTAFRVLDRVSDIVTVDNLTVHEDMAGKSGPMIGPNLIKEFMLPYYRRIWDMLSSKGTKLFSQDSDGNINPIIDAMLECGVNVTFPAEPAADMDIVALRKKYGSKLAFKGGIDKHVLRGTKAEIRAELEYKLQPEMRIGTVFGLDHRIPNGTPIENYRYYVETAREILGLPPLNKNRSGWARMAF